MAALDPLHISPFFSATDTLTRKKNKDEKTSVRSKREFDKILHETEEARHFETEVLKNRSLQEQTGVSFEQKLTELVDAVYAAGDELKKNPFTDTFVTYRQKLSQFIRFVVQNAYEVEIRERRKGTKRQQLITVQTINAKLDELAADILYNQTDQLKILAKVEEINGILVDFLS